MNNPHQHGFLPGCARTPAPRRLETDRGGPDFVATFEITNLFGETFEVKSGGRRAAAL
jgi:hypothetical protein